MPLDLSLPQILMVNRLLAQILSRRCVGRVPLSPRGRGPCLDHDESLLWAARSATVAPRAGSRRTASAPIRRHLSPQGSERLSRAGVRPDLPAPLLDDRLPLARVVAAQGANVHVKAHAALPVASADRWTRSDLRWRCRFPCFHRSGLWPAGAPPLCQLFSERNELRQAEGIPVLLQITLILTYKPVKGIPSTQQKCCRNGLLCPDVIERKVQPT